MTVELFASILSIVIIDLTISGDNALVIGMAAHRLPSRQRRIAILFGAGGAIMLRVLFTSMAAILLSVPLLQALGGLVLLWIALKLLRQGVTEPSGSYKEAVGLTEAIRIIIIADVIMSLDNILAVAGASHGNIQLLIFGLMLSMPIVMTGSAIVASLINRFSWLLQLGAAVLGWTAGRMILEDQLLTHYIPEHWALEIGLPAFLTVGVLVVGTLWNRAAAKAGEAREAEKVPEVSGPQPMVDSSS